MELTNLKLSGKTRKEKDLLGEREIPIEHYFGIQTQRALENFSISRTKSLLFTHIWTKIVGNLLKKN